MIKWDHTPNHLYNVYEAQNQKENKTFSAGPIIRTAQGHTKVQLPKDFCIEKTDRIGFYIECVDPAQYLIRRICRVFTEGQFNTLTKEEQKHFNIRKVRPANNVFHTIVPMTAIQAPPPWKMWTHIIFHYSKDPNLYFMEFKDLSKIMQEEKPKEDTPITFGQCPFPESNIRWD